MTERFHIHTLHRGKYMLCFFIGLFLAGALGSKLPIKEIFKVVTVLFTIPLILYIAVKISQQPSTWILSENKLIIDFGGNVKTIDLQEVDHIRSLTRSGGNLYVIYFHKKSPLRIWRNKLFQEDDDHIALHEALLTHPIEYYKF